MNPPGKIDKGGLRGRLTVELFHILAEWERADKGQWAAEAAAQSLTPLQLLAAVLTEAALQVLEVS